MAEKSFGVEELNVLGSGTPTISAPTTLNLDCHTVGVSTSLTVGANLSVSGISTIAQPADSNPIANWTITNNSAVAYRFTGPGQSGTEDDPNLYLVRGQRYIFKHNATASHPIQIRVASGGAAYTDGITYSDVSNNATTHGNNLIFNVQHDAPARLYYQCTSHGPMVGNIYIIGGPQVISGVVTATTFVGNLTGTASNNAVLTGSTNNTLVTVTGSNAITGEANLTFDGSSLSIGGKNTLSSSSIITYSPDSSVRYQMGVNNTDGVSLLSKNTSGSYNTYQIDANTFKVRTTGTNTPAERLRILSNGHIAIGDDIANDTGMFKVIAADGQSDDQYVGQFKNLEATTNRNWGLLIQAGSSSTDESLRVRNGANNADHLTIRGDGVVTKPKTPTFAAQGSGDAISAQSPLPYDSILYNNGSHYNSSTYKFNIPVNGYYYVTCHVVPTNFATPNNVELYIKDDQGNRYFLDRKVKSNNYSTNNFSVGGSRILYKTAGADLWVEFNSINGSPTLESSSHFGIMLMA